MKIIMFLILAILINNYGKIMVLMIHSKKLTLKHTLSNNNNTKRHMLILFLLFNSSHIPCSNLSSIILKV